MVAANIVLSIHSLSIQASFQNSTAHSDWSPNQTFPQPKVLKCRVPMESMSISVLYPSDTFMNMSCKKETITCLKMVGLHPIGPNYA
jgi:hypothetical protein